MNGLGADKAEKVSRSTVERLAQTWRMQASVWLVITAGEVSAKDVDALRRKVGEVWMDCARELMEAIGDEGV